MMQYEDIKLELHEVQKQIDALEGLSFSLNCIITSMRQKVASIELGVQRTIDTQDDLK